MSVFVFRYAVGEGLAVAIVPADKACVFYAGRHKLVHYTQDGTWHKLVVDPADEIHCMSPEDAVPYAHEMHAQLVEQGTISPVPLPENKPKAPTQRPPRPAPGAQRVIGEVLKEAEVADGPKGPPDAQA